MLAHVVVHGEAERETGGSKKHAGIKAMRPMEPMDLLQYRRYRRSSRSEKEEESGFVHRPRNEK